MDYDLADCPIEDHVVPLKAPKAQKTTLRIRENKNQIYHKERD